MRLTLTLALLSVYATALPAQWAQTMPTTSPSQRRAGAMAFDSSGNRLLIYGGVSATPAVILSQTWAYNGQWTLLPATAPARWGHQMVRNTSNGRILTFGGRSPTITGLANDTLQWSGTSWATITTATAPSPRFLYGMCFDSVRDRFVLFGGRSSQGVLDETWEFDGNNWIEIPTSTRPPAREEMAMAYDATLNRTVLFGGCDEATSTVYGDTWYYDGADWQLQAPTASPSPRFRTAAAYDSVRGRIVLYGGFDGSQIVNQTHEWTGDQWLQITTGMTFPPNATETYSGYDPVRRKFVVFGGFGGSFSNETWEYTGLTTGVFGTFGQGCDTVAGEPGISATTPTIGQPFDVTIDNLPVTPTPAQAVIVATGLSNQTFGGIPLPVSLAIIGLPPVCDLLVSADLLELALVTAPGSVTYSLAIPNQMSLLNLPLYVQGLVLDIAPFGFLGASAGGRAIIGM